jgi:hypothetical protein
MTLLPAHPTDRVATAVLLFSATLWGLSWMPLKWFIAQGLPGPLVSLLTYGSVGLLALFCSGASAPRGARSGACCWR